MSASSSQPTGEIKRLIAQSVIGALAAAREAGELALADLPSADAFQVERPPSPEFGDWSCNAAMVLAKAAKQPPRRVAETIVRHLPPSELIERVEVAGAGFLNFFLKPAWLHAAVHEALERDADYGKNDTLRGRKIQVEFVSANPTGPLNVVSGRAAAYGDTLAGLLAWCGAEITREYYVNDALHSTQIERFGLSLEARYCQALGQDKPLPADAYQGEYLAEMGAQIAHEHGDRYLALSEQERVAAFTGMALARIVADAKAVLEAFGVRYQVWFHESQLVKSGAVEAVVEALRQAGHTYEAEGAVWFRATAFGVEKDEVLIRRTGQPAYLAGDLAYHRDKHERGFSHVIDIWGPDHHGHVARTLAGVKALGYPEGWLEIIIHQMVRLVRGGELVRMSKRAGEIVALSDLVSDVGKDVARFFFLMRSADAALDFDLELAKQESEENPVYYVQYGHARICSILREAEKRGVPLPRWGEVNLALLREPDELAVMRALADFPEEVEQAAHTRGAHRMTRYAQELARIFHSFYTNCRVLGDDPALTAARLALVQASRIVLRNVCGILGIEAPERM